MTTGEDRQIAVRASLRADPRIPEIVAERFAADLFTSTKTEPGVDQCVYDSGAGRCDGAYHHKGKLHYRMAGPLAPETWESPW